MALFQSDLKDIVRRLSSKDSASAEERDELLKRLEATEGVRARDVTWMLFRPDRALRDVGIRLLGRIKDPETVDAFVSEARAKPDAALRSAIQSLGTIPVPDRDQKITQLLAPPPKETKDSREIQALARRILLELPINPSIAAILW